MGTHSIFNRTVFSTEPPLVCFLSPIDPGLGGLEARLLSRVNSQQPGNSTRFSVRYEHHHFCRR